MALKIKWTSLALHDLQEIKAYIQKDKPAAAQKEAKRIRQSVERLSRFPKSGKTLKNIFQVFEVISGSYRIFYRIDSQIEILRIFHGKRFFALIL